MGNIQNRHFLNMSDIEAFEMKIVPKRKTEIAGQAKRNYDLCAADDIAGLIPHGSKWDREIIIKRKEVNGELKLIKIHPCSSVYETLHYPLLFPTSGHAW